MSEKRPAQQIKPAHAIALAAVSILLAGAAVVMLWFRDPPPARQLTLDTGSGRPVPTAGSAAGSMDLQSRPEVKAYAERQAFEQRIQTYLKTAEGLSDAERDAAAEALEAEIVRREAAREFSAGEALLLRMSLLRARSGDEPASLQRAQVLADQYRSDTARRQAAFEEAQHNDPRFRSYKQREAEIVAEVQAMSTFPRGLSRDEYLRQRLQEAREAAYAQPAPSAERSPAPAQAPTLKPAAPAAP